MHIHTCIYMCVCVGRRNRLTIPPSGEGEEDAGGQRKRGQKVTPRQTLFSNSLFSIILDFLYYFFSVITDILLCNECVRKS